MTTKLSKKLRIKTVHLLKNSTLHALPRILTSEHKFQKFFWFIIFLISSGYCSLFIYQNILNYLEYNVATKIETAYEYKPDFPSVTICDFNTFYCHFNGLWCPRESIVIKNNHCIIFNSGLNISGYQMDALKSAQAGLKSGLILSIQPSKGRPAYVYVNNQSSLNDENSVIRVGKSMIIDVAIKRVYKKKLSKPFSDCQKDYTFSLGVLDIVNKTSYPYILSDCFSLCKIEEIMKACNQSNAFDLIKQYYFTRVRYFYSKYSEYISNCSLGIIDSVEIRFVTLGENKICQGICPQACDSFEYSIKINSNYEPEKPRSEIFIYFEDFHYTLITDQAQTTVESLFGSIGGLLGLFLGTSLVSFFEFSDLIFSLIFIVCENMKTKIIKISDNFFEKKISPNTH